MRAVFLAVCLAAFGLPSAAQAVTITVTAPGSSGRTLTVSLAGATRVTIARDGSAVLVAGRPTDTINVTGGCTATSSGDGVTCGAETSFNRIVVNGSSGADEIEVSSSISRAVTVSGNGGNDEIAGGSGNDTLDGGPGNDVIRAGEGNDTLDGSAGNDTLVGDAGNDTLDGGTGDDVLSGGGQAGDTLDYAGRTAPVWVDLGGARPSGEALEADVVDGFAIVLGGSGADTLLGGPADERLEGNGGADVLRGGGGNDTLNGGAGADSLDGGAGVDAFNGGEGDDTLFARDGEVDAAITCGGGRDRLASDAFDPAPDGCEVLAPLVTGEVAVAGEPVVGGALRAAFSGGVSGTDSTRGWRWERCTVGGCALVGFDASYALTVADAGARLKVVLRAENEAGAGELESVLVGPVAVPPAVVEPPAPAPPAPPAGSSVRVRSLACAGRRCRIALTLSEPVARVRVELAKGKRTLASVTRKPARGRFTLTVTARRRLARGRYTVRVTATGATTVTKTIRVKR